MTLHPTIARVTDRIRERSLKSRGLYLDRMNKAARRRPRCVRICPAAIRPMPMRQ